MLIVPVRGWNWLYNDTLDNRVLPAAVWRSACLNTTTRTKKQFQKFNVCCGTTPPACRLPSWALLPILTNAPAARFQRRLRNLPRGVKAEWAAPYCSGFWLDCRLLTHFLVMIYTFWSNVPAHSDSEHPAWFGLLSLFQSGHTVSLYSSNSQCLFLSLPLSPSLFVSPPTHTHTFFGNPKSVEWR